MRILGFIFKAIVVATWIVVGYLWLNDAGARVQIGTCAWVFLILAVWILWPVFTAERER
jgi:hypothetical protein